MWPNDLLVSRYSQYFLFISLALSPLSQSLGMEIHQNRNLGVVLVALLLLSRNLFLVDLRRENNVRVLIPAVLNPLILCSLNCDRNGLRLRNLASLNLNRVSVRLGELLLLLFCRFPSPRLRLRYALADLPLLRFPRLDLPEINL